MKITMTVVGIAIGIVSVVLMYRTGNAASQGQYDKATFELILAIFNFYLSCKLVDYS